MIYNERDGLYFMTLYTAEKEIGVQFGCRPKLPPLV